MTEHTARRRAAGVLVGLTASAALLTGCFSKDQGKVMDQVNATRADAGVRKLAADDKVMAKAQAWSEHMARTGVLEHTGGGGRLDPSGIPNWCAVYENVGQGPSTYAVHNGFLNSPHHYSNMVQKGTDRIGTGVAVKGGTVWITEIFVRSC